MSLSHLPLILEPDELERQLGVENVIIVDLCKHQTYAEKHIPGAIHFDYAQLVRAEMPTMGLLPDIDHLNELFSDIGLKPDQHVIAYDDEGGGKACRLLWTLEVCGHKQYSLLNGGIHAWANEGHPLSEDVTTAKSTNYEIKQISDEALASRDYILEHLKDASIALLDARTAEEYSGEVELARRGGHIPGAVNMEWTQAMDQQRNLRLKSDVELRSMLEQRGITPDKTVVVYCQTHHRSAHTFIALKAIGYEDVKGYPGSWSDWGNQQDTPVEMA